MLWVCGDIDIGGFLYGMKLQQSGMSPNMFVLRILKTCPLMLGSYFMLQTHLVDDITPIAYVDVDRDALL